MRNAKEKKRFPLGMKSDYATPFIEKRELNWCIDWIRRDWRGSNPQLPPWQGGALTNWTTIPGRWKERIYPKIGFFFIPLYQVFLKGKGLYYLMRNWRIFGPSWIWTSVDILPTNLQSVPINRSGIDPGRILFRLIGNSWSTSFPSTLPPGEVESPLPPWKRDVLNR